MMCSLNFTTRSSQMKSHIEKCLPVNLLHGITVFIFLLQAYAAVRLPNNEKVPAVLVFGDSIVDPGNNNHIPTLVRCNFPPYGRDFLGGNATGRFSNGLVPSDLIAQKFGVKELVPAYFDSSLQIQDLLTGVSFASGGAGYDPLTAEIASVLSLSAQLDMFRDYIKKIKDAVGENRSANIISESIYIISTGSDDIANTYYQTPFRRQEFDISAYTDLMAASASSFLEELYRLGGRRIGVFGLTAIGCVPLQRTLLGGVGRPCSNSTNNAAVLFNSKLMSVMDSLSKRFPDARLVYLDSYSPFLTLLQNPDEYGFDVLDKGCCGTGNIEVTLLCNRYSIETCYNSSGYIFWDSYHPTEKVYRILISLIIDKNIKNFF